MHLTLPQLINSDALLPFLNLLSLHRDKPEVTLDFSFLNRISPAGFSALTAWQNYRKKQNLKTLATGLSSCPITSYLERFNLLEVCNWQEIPEATQRHDPTKRFIPLEQIDIASKNLVSALPTASPPMEPILKIRPQAFGMPLGISLRKWPTMFANTVLEMVLSPPSSPKKTTSCASLSPTAGEESLAFSEQDSSTLKHSMTSPVLKKP